MKKALAIVAVAVAAFLFFTRQKPEGVGLPAKSAAKENSGASNSAARARSSGAPNAAANLSYPEIAMSRVGVKTVPYGENEQGKGRLRIFIKAKPGCHPGDFEAMEFAMGKGGRVLLSVESLKSGGKGFRRALSLAEIDQGVTVSVDTDKIDSSKAVGLFLCSDGAGNNSCVGKKAADFNSIFSGGDNVATKNAIFYFQIAFFGANGSLVYSGNPRGVPAAREQLMAANIGGKELAEDLEKATVLMRQVQSLPPLTRGEGVETALEIPVAKAGANCGLQKR